MVCSRRLVARPWPISLQARLNLPQLSPGWCGQRGRSTGHATLLLPGQALTTGEGGLWRWDGFVRRAAAQDGGAERIRQRQRLESLEELVTAAAEDSLLSEKSAAAEAARKEAAEVQATCRAAASKAEADLAAARREDETSKLRLTTAEDRAAELNETIAALAAELAQTEGEAAGLGDDSALAAAEETARVSAE